MHLDHYSTRIWEERAPGSAATYRQMLRTEYHQPRYDVPAHTAFVNTPQGKRDEPLPLRGHSSSQRWFFDDNSRQYEQAGPDAHFTSLQVFQVSRACICSPFVPPSLNRRVTSVMACCCAGQLSKTRPDAHPCAVYSSSDCLHYCAGGVHTAVLIEEPP